MLGDGLAVGQGAHPACLLGRRAGCHIEVRQPADGVVISGGRNLLEVGDLSNVGLTFHEVPTLDTVMHRITQGPDGAIWFTDPSFGIGGWWEGEPAEQELPHAVYRIDAQGQLHQVLTILVQNAQRGGGHHAVGGQGAVRGVRQAFLELQVIDELLDRGTRNIEGDIGRDVGRDLRGRVERTSIEHGDRRSCRLPAPRSSG